MTLCGEFITHRTFGRGQITDISEHCITVLFDETHEKKKFVNPSALGTFLILENKTLVRQMQEEKDLLAQKAESEAEEHRQAAAAVQKPVKRRTRPAAKKPPRKPKDTEASEEQTI
ncbi:hypothetical protein [Papillibacter cinnamivorans]|uniref:Uncharacterized protein n=1 Tax=Papillibacter cinnamivorans DSM 12816 TaxID=1122930 RepID=A0A1W2C3Y6_9FIRM|nr:hypothetical protein [Papillibacter cinnamivorans]SMC79899.1 hypothetical protein SAMN02745168_2543 [Papillibacter cinnamivorans DSM 12816]